MPPSPWYAVVLALQACADGVVPQTHGHQVHGLFLDLIQRIDPALSAAIHQGSARRPYTLSPLLGLSEADHNGHAVPAGAEFHLRLTILDARLFGGAIAALLGESPAQQVRLGRMRFAVRHVATAPDQHPWAGIITPQQLREEARPERRISLHFATPTAFSLGSRPGAGKIVETLPRPELVFGGLLSAWNAFADVRFDPAVRRIVAEQMVVSRFNLRTAAYQFRDHTQIGALGRVVYEIKGSTPDETLRALNTLADATRYLGVGYRTTMGMGQTRRVTANDSHDLA